MDDKATLPQNGETEESDDNCGRGKGSLSLKEIGEFFLSRKRAEHFDDLEADPATQPEPNWEDECAFSCVECPCSSVLNSRKMKYPKKHFASFSLPPSLCLCLSLSVSLSLCLSLSLARSLCYMYIGKSKPVPIPVQLSVSVLQRCSHHLAHENASVRMCVLECVEHCLVALSDHSKLLLPEVHCLWPAFVHRLSDKNLPVQLKVC